MAADVDNIFSVKILLNFIASAFIICLLGFMVIVHDDFMEHIRFTFALLCFIGQIHFVCWLGDVITTAVCISFSFCWNAGLEYLNETVFIFSVARLVKAFTLVLGMISV